MRPRSTITVLSAIALLLTSCGKGVKVVLDEPFPKKLSAWRLLTGEPGKFRWNENVVPYDVNTPLFSDYATKSRAVWMPPGTAATYHASEAFDFPKGTIFAKTFAYPGRTIETRLLVHANSGWVALPYVWNQEQTEAFLEIAADPVDIEYQHPSGEKLQIHYLIPNQNQCKGCHERSKQLVPIGPKARHLNRDFEYSNGKANQIARWVSTGYLRGAPDPAQAPRLPVWDDPATGTLEDRALAYLDANCAHCHNPEGPANTSGLYYTYGIRDPLRLGFCKVPVAAGQGAGDLRFDAVHGKPDESILIRRLESLQPKVMMPELGRASVHAEGARLLRAWITATQGSCVP